ncbi:MAG: hypothetical protein CL488_00110 [Acidobacteria bacterium]|nr:hypothetical protein [Acidobacteriota bacterium]
MGSSGLGKNTPMPADPRPELSEEDGIHLLLGGRCRACGLASTYLPPICPCGQAGQVEPCGFGPAGTVFSSTVLYIPIPERPPPSCLAYIDLDDGPRILAHVHLGAGPQPMPGDRVSLDGKNALGDLLVKPDRAAGLNGAGAKDE